MIQDIREQIEIENYGRALSRIDNLLWREGENAELRGLRGIALISQGLFTEGIQDLEKSISSIDVAEFRYWRSLAYFEEKEFNKSIEDAERAVQLEKNNYDYLSHLMLLYQNLNYIKESLSIANHVLSIEKGNVLGLEARAYVYIKWQEYDKAIADYQEILAQNYYQEDIFNNIGYCYDQKSEYDSAWLYYEKALEINPYHAYALSNAGLLYCRKGEIQKGEKMILKSIRYDRGNSYAYKNMGKAKLLQESKDEALQYLLKARELGYSEDFDKDVESLLAEEFNILD